MGFTVDAPGVLPIYNTSTALIAANLVLKFGQIAQEINTNRAKVGDGDSTYTQLSYSEWTYEIVEAAGTDTYTSTFSSPIFLVYFAMMRIRVRFANANTGPATLNLNGLGAISIVKNVSTALAAGDILAGGIYHLIYDGTNFQITFSGGGGSGISGSGIAGQVVVWNGVNSIAGNAGMIYNSATDYLSVNGGIRIGSLVDPTVALDVTGAALISTTLGITTSLTCPLIQGSSAASGTLTLRATSSATDGAIIFETDPTTERMRILSTGAVLVGSSTVYSAEQLSVQKNFNGQTNLIVSNTTSGTGANSVIFVTSKASFADWVGVYSMSAAWTTSGMYVQGAGVINSNKAAGLNIGTYNATQLSFWTNNTERMRVLSTGELLVGTTTLFSTEKFALRNDQNFATGVLMYNNMAGTLAQTYFRAASNGCSIYMGAQSTLFTTDGLILADQAYLLTQAASAGLLIGNLNAAPIQFCANGKAAADLSLHISSVNNISIGGSAVRGTTVGTKALQIFNGTAQAGTLTDGVSLQSVSGYLKSIDAAGLVGAVLSASAVNVVSPTVPNRTITINYLGTTYYIHAKTTND